MTDRQTGWLLVFTIWCLGLCFAITLNGCMTVASTPEANSICMTVDNLNRQLSESYANGYQKAKAEARPRADVELNLITQSQLIAFLKEDGCDRCGGSDDCLERANCLTASARTKGYDVYGVIINFAGGGAHALVAFPTSDNGIIYIEPWYDQIVKVVVGTNYLSNFPKEKGKKIIQEIGILY